MSFLTVASVSLRRYLRDRTAMFFVVALPILVIVVIGMTVRDFTEFKVAVVDDGAGTLGHELTHELDKGSAIQVVHSSSVSAARTAVRRGEVSVAVVVPAGADDALRSGKSVQIQVFADRTNDTQQAALAAVSSIVGNHATSVQAAQFATRNAGGTFDQNLEVARGTESKLGRLTVESRVVDQERSFLPEGFSYSAPTMLVLFVFINSMAGGAAIIESRRLRMYERIIAAPVPIRSVILGETLCYLCMAFLQSAIILAVGALAFDVHWGSLAAAGALVTTWALVGTGAGVLSGTLFRTPEQAAALGPPIGIVLGMLGGCMWPLEIVPAAMRTVGHLFPHAWAVDAWTGVMSRGEGIVDIGRPLLVLLGWAGALLALATMRLRRTITA